VKISDRSGQTWRVSRRWVPWRRRLKGFTDAMPDLPGLGDDPISAVFGIIMLILAIPFLLLVLAGGLEFVLLFVVLPFGILGRVLFGQHWTIEVRQGWRPWWEAPAGNWRESALRIHDVAAEIERGTVPPQTIPT